jgi:hypothetical protein
MVDKNRETMFQAEKILMPQCQEVGYGLIHTCELKNEK